MARGRKGRRRSRQPAGGVSDSSRTEASAATVQMMGTKAAEEEEEVILDLSSLSLSSEAAAAGPSEPPPPREKGKKKKGKAGKRNQAAAAVEVAAAEAATPMTAAAAPPTTTTTTTEKEEEEVSIASAATSTSRPMAAMKKKNGGKQRLEDIRLSNRKNESEMEFQKFQRIIRMLSSVLADIEGVSASALVIKEEEQGKKVSALLRLATSWVEYLREFSDVAMTNIAHNYLRPEAGSSIRMTGHHIVQHSVHLTRETHRNWRPSPTIPQPSLQDRDLLLLAATTSSSEEETAAPPTVKAAISKSIKDLRQVQAAAKIPACPSSLQHLKENLVNSHLREYLKAIADTISSLSRIQESLLKGTPYYYN